MAEASSRRAQSWSAFSKAGAAVQGSGASVSNLTELMHKGRNMVKVHFFLPPHPILVPMHYPSAVQCNDLLLWSCHTKMPGLPSLTLTSRVSPAGGVCEYATRMAHMQHCILLHTHVITFGCVLQTFAANHRLTSEDGELFPSRESSFVRGSGSSFGARSRGSFTGPSSRTAGPPNLQRFSGAPPLPCCP